MCPFRLQKNTNFKIPLFSVKIHVSYMRKLRFYHVADCVGLTSKADHNTLKSIRLDFLMVYYGSV